MERLMKKPVQLYVLGDGEEEYRNMFLSYQEQYPDKVYVQLDYTDEMAKYIYAGCDAILMPSHFEPCGLCQLMSLRYWAVPIIRKTGGLKDTVSIYNPKSKKRADYVEKAAEILMKYRDGKTPVGVVRHAGREDESSYITTLDAVKDAPIDMFSLVIVGNSNRYVRDGKMITPRGYEDKYGFANVE